MGSESSGAALRIPVAAKADRLREVLRARLSGRLPTIDEITLVLESGSETLEEVLDAAGALRDRAHGRTVTYSPKVFLPVTNLCRDRCSYCTFRKDSWEDGAWTMTLDEIARSCDAARELGCREALLCLGDRPEATSRHYRAGLRLLGAATTVDYLARACEVALSRGMWPHANAGVLSASELASLRPVNASMGLMLENVSPRLCARGGPHHAAPDKDPAVRLRMLEDAGRLRIAFTTGILVGIGETKREIAESLAAIRDVHARWGHVQEIIVQNFRAKPDTRMADADEPTDPEFALAVAAARLAFPDAMNLQAPPNLSPRNHALLLRAGINDWGGISPLTPDFVNPEAPWPHVAKLAETCSRAGFDLRPRLPVYAEFARTSEFVPAGLFPALRDELSAREVA